MRNQRILITGYPVSGKSTFAGVLANVTGHIVKPTDSLIELEWSAQSARVASWFEHDGPWIIEGTTIPRAIRKWRTLPGYKQKRPPFDTLVVMRRSMVGMLPGQIRMSKQIDDILVGLMAWIIMGIGSSNLYELGEPSWQEDEKV